MNKTLKGRVKTLLVISIAILLIFSTVFALSRVGGFKAFATADTGGWTSCPATEYEDAIDNSKWVVYDAVSSGTTATADSKNYVKISSLNKSGAHVNYPEKIDIETQTVSFKITGYNGGRLGFGLTSSANGNATEDGLLNVVFQRYGIWDFFYYQDGNYAEDQGNENEHFIAYSDAELTKKEYGIDGSNKYAFTARGDNTIEFSLKFNKVSDTVWSIQLDGGAQRSRSDVVYVSADYIPSNEVYFSVWGVSGAQNSYIKAFEMKPTPGSHLTARYQTVTDSTHLYHIYSSWGDSSVRNSDKLSVDGLEVILTVNSINNGIIDGVSQYLAKGSCYALTFTQNKDADATALASQNKFTASLWPYIDGETDTNGLYFRTSHDYNSAAIARLEKDGEIAENLTEYYDGNRYLLIEKDTINGNGDYVGFGKISVGFKFEKEGNKFKITTTLYTGTQFGKVYEDVLQPVTSDEEEPLPIEYEKMVCYVDESLLNLDADGKAYLAFYGFCGQDLIDNGLENDCFVRIINPGTTEYVDRDDTENTDPEMDYYDSATGEYIGGCFAGVSTSSIFVSLGVIATATVLFILKRKFSGK